MSEPKIRVLRGNCLEVMRSLPADSVDSIVTDPPYELNFMGKSWDSAGVSFDPATWAEALRVLKPGGHLLAFGGSRTYHRIAVAIEDAGFEIRDSLMWIYGSGFPKSLDVSKSMDKKAGAKRAIVGTGRTGTGRTVMDAAARSGDLAGTYDITAPATDDAKRWEGWGTALKPSHEPIVLARKPLIGTVAENVLAHGTGALNIDASRIGTETRTYDLTMTSGNFETTGGNKNRKSGSATVVGRWPANTLWDEEAAAMLDAQSGHSKSTKNTRDDGRVRAKNERLAQAPGNRTPENSYGDSGGASRFFYVAKPSKREREVGLADFSKKPAGSMSGGEETRPDRPTNHPLRANIHPTVKPIALMRYLVRLITPPGGTVLDPFLGSGTTACAAALEGFDCIGIEMNDDYADIAEARIEHWKKEAE